VTYTWQVFGAVNNVNEAAVNDVATVIQCRIKHDLWLFSTHRNQHHWPLDVLEVIKLGRVITKVIASLHTHSNQHHWPLNVLEVIKLGRVITEVIASLHTHIQKHTSTHGCRQRNE